MGHHGHQVYGGHRHNHHWRRRHEEQQQANNCPPCTTNPGSMGPMAQMGPMGQMGVQQSPAIARLLAQDIQGMPSMG